MVARTIATAIVMHRASWLHLLGLPREVQSTVEDLTFKGLNLFACKTDESLHSLKDSRATLRSLGIYIPSTKHKQGRYYTSQRPRLRTHRTRDSMILKDVGKDHPNEDQILRSPPHHSNWPPNTKFKGLVKGLIANSMFHQPSVYRLSGTILLILAYYHCRQMCIRDHQDQLLHPVPLHPPVPLQGSLSPITLEIGNRIPPATRLGRTSASTTKRERLLFPLFFNTKEVWGMETHSLPQETKQICQNTFQDGYFSSNNFCTGTRGLVCSTRPAKCIYSRPLAPSTKAIPLILYWDKRATFST